MSTTIANVSSLIAVAIEAVMPKGVEHSRTPAVFFIPNEAIEAVMPKGVEHMDVGETLSGGLAAIEAVMPKGVEHLVEWS